MTEKMEIIKIADRKMRAGEGRIHSAALREQNRIRIAQQRFKGVPFREIASELGVSVGYVYSEYKHVEEQWRAESRKSLDELKSRELAKIDLIEQEAWKAWERSCEQALKMREDYAFNSEGTRQRKKAQALREDQAGNPKFLDVIAKCIDRRCKLLGLDAEIVQPAKEGAALSDLETRLQRYQGVLGVIAVGISNPLALGDSVGEPMDSTRSPSETGAILDAHGSIREST